VDFLFLGPGKRGRIFKMCVEFKNAHSPDLISGLSNQLRKYMCRLEVSDGAYCVLDYRCPLFQLPNRSTEELFAELEHADLRYSELQNKPIKVHWLELGIIGYA